MESDWQLKEIKYDLKVKELELSKERQFVQILVSNRTNSRQLNNTLTSKNDCLTQNDKKCNKGYNNKNCTWTNWVIRYRFKTI